VKEQAAWESNVKQALKKDSARWQVEVGQHYADSVAIDVLVDLVGPDHTPDDLRKLAGRLDVVTTALGDDRASNSVKEGMDVARANIAPLSTSLLDLGKLAATTGGATRRLDLNELDLIKLACLLRRQLISRLAVYADSLHDGGWVRLASAIFVCARKGTLIGRIVADLRPLNKLARNVAVPSCLTTAIHHPLLGCELLSELDISNAFPSLPLSQGLMQFHGLSSVLSILVAVRSMLGFAPLPGVFQQFVVSRFLRTAVNTGAVAAFDEEFWKAVDSDLEADAKREEPQIPQSIRLRVEQYLNENTAEYAAPCTSAD
jgi:hypothetical protein